MYNNLGMYSIQVSTEMSQTCHKKREGVCGKERQPAVSPGIGPHGFITNSNRNKAQCSVVPPTQS